MNPVLAQIYGTGIDKTASAEGELDFDNMTASQLLAGLEDGSIVFDDESEKVAGDGEIDLSQLTGAELLELLSEADEYESEKTAAATLEKMAADGSLDFYDTAGRIMAHAYADELSKVAGADEIEVDLDNISGDDLLELLEAGYEFDGLDKTAAAKLAAFIGPLQRTKGGKLTAAQKREFRAAMKAQQKGPDRGRSAVQKYEAANKKSGRTLKGLGIEAGMKGRHYGGKALAHLKGNKGRYGAAAALLGAAGAGGYGVHKMKKS